MNIVDWIYPKMCVECGEEGKYVCSECEKTIVRIDDSLRYTGIVRKIIKEIKYRGTYDMVKELVTLWDPQLPTNCSDAVVTSVPMWAPKKRLRGFNQAELIAREVAHRWHISYKDLLVRTRETQPMYGLTKVERLANINEVFVFDTHAPLPRKVIVIDDVWTTGATLMECARVLREGGVRSVRTFALAR